MHTRVLASGGYMQTQGKILEIDLLLKTLVQVSADRIQTLLVCNPAYWLDVERRELTSGRLRSQVHQH